MLQMTGLEREKEPTEKWGLRSTCLLDFELQWWWFYIVLVAPWTALHLKCHIAIEQYVKQWCGACQFSHAVQRNNSTINFDIWNCIYFWFGYWLKSLDYEGGQENEASAENYWWNAQENATYYCLKIPAPNKIKTHTLALVASRESREINSNTMLLIRAVLKAVHRLLV